MDRLFATTGSELGRLMAVKDWSRTSLGPPETWSPALRTATGICLESRFPMLIWWGERLTMIYNDAYRPVLGERKHPDALGQDGAEAWPEIWDVIGPMLEGVLRDGEATWSDDQELVLDRNGFLEECFFTFSYSPIRDDEGRVCGVFTAVSETTDRVVSERRLRLVRTIVEAASAAQSEGEVYTGVADALRAGADDVPFAVLYLVDLEAGRARLVMSTGATADEGEDLDLGSGGPTAAIITAAARRRTPLDVPDVEGCWAPHAPGDGPPGAASAVALPVRTRGGPDVLGVLVTGLNPRRPVDDGYRGFLDLVARSIGAGVADARATEHDRRRAADAQELSDAKSAFFDNVSHEFRTPLTLLLSPLEDALEDTEQPLVDAQLDRVAVAHRNALRLRRLVNSLLDFSRWEGGRRQTRWQPVDLARLTAELASAFDSAVDGAGLRLRIDCPPLAKPVVVDAEQWERVVLNLVSNALKHTWEGEIAVTLADDEAAEEVVLTVSDTGTGIPPEEVPRLFERFHRVPNAQGRSHEGTGIGLALVQEVVGAHGGTVAVESVLGRGSAFTVRLPYGHEHVSAEALAAPRSPVPSLAEDYLADARMWGAETEMDADGAGAAATPPAGDARRARVVLADDNADMRRYVSRLLAGAYEVEAVSDGATALERVLADPPDLLLTDVMMPGLDGVELLQRLRADQRTARLPIVLLSARAGQDASVGALEAGADDYLVKPFSALELVARVRANLEMGRLREDATRSVRALYDHEHAMVEELQRSLLPAELPDLPDVRLAGRYLPASPGDAVGGDWYDVARLPDERVMVVVGDVVGHGLRAASTMSHLRTAARAYAAEGHDPTGVVDRVSALVEKTGNGLGSTMFLAFVDPVDGELTYASAGHPPALVAGPDGGARWLDHGLAPPLGLASAAAAKGRTDRLAAGETLVLFTDGLVERRDVPLQDRLDQLASCVARDGEPDDLLDRLVRKMGVGEERGDDVALVALRHVPARAALSLDLGVDSDLGAVRADLRGWLGRLDADEDTMDEVVLAVSEALINAIEHAGLGGEGIALRATGYDDRLRVVVRDRGRWQRQGPARARGHGLRIIRAVMDDVDLDIGGDGTRLELHRALERT